MTFQVLKEAGIEMTVFWAVAPCALMMEAASTFETSVCLYQSSRLTSQKTVFFG
jgi:hypothetical protein